MVTSAYEKATAVIPISSMSSARQNRPPFSETKSRDSDAKSSTSGSSGWIAIAVPAGSPPPASSQVCAAVLGEHERWAPVDDRDDPLTRLVGGDQQRQRDAGGSGRRLLVVDELGLARLEIDVDAPERRRDESLHQRAMIVETKRLAIRPASFASAPRCRATA